MAYGFIIYKECIMKKLWMIGALVMLCACGQNDKQNSEFKPIEPQKIQESAIDLIGNQWMLISAGTPDSFNTMTASWGALGQLWGKPAAFIFVRKTRYTKQFIDNGDTFTLTVFPNEYRPALQLLGTKSGRDGDKIKEAGLTPFFTAAGNPAFKEARLVIECKKRYHTEIGPDGFFDDAILKEHYSKGESKDNYHEMYVGEITAAWYK